VTCKSAVPAKTAIGALALLLLWSGSAGPGGVRSAAAQQETQADTISISTARFWRGDGRTLIEGVVGLPIPAAANTNPLVELTVRDQSGQVLSREEWTDTISERMTTLARNRGGAELTRPIQFAVSAGRYQLTLKVRNGTLIDSAVTTVEGFAAAPLVSDVLVSNRIRLLAEGQEATLAETRKGRYAIERSTHVTILPTEPTLKFFMELYGTGRSVGDTAQVEYAVQRQSGGAPLFRTQSVVPLGAGGAINAANLPLQGLPPGDYVLVTTVQAAGRREQRTTPVAMGTFEAAPVVAAAPAAGAGEADVHDRYFAVDKRSNEAIGQLLEALLVAPPSGTVDRNARQLTPDAQRRYLARYFSRLPDPRPATPGHELIEEFIQRVEFVSREYAERQIGRSAFSTDRGRIYLRYGPPDAKQLMPNLTGNRAVEIWKYTRDRSFKFAFLDETGFSNFKMVYTTDPTEVSVPDWQERVRDIEAIRMIQLF